MGLLAIALNDAGVALASGRSLLVESPGYAIVEDGGFLVGEPARRHSKINPRLVHNRFWDGLSTEALARPAPQATLVADLAAAHLAHLWDRRPDDTEGAIFVVPGTYSQQQLGLLLGIAEERRVPVRGLVDAALACCHQPCSNGALLHLDLHLHRVVLTVLEQGHPAAPCGRQPVPKPSAWFPSTRPGQSSLLDNSYANRVSIRCTVARPSRRCTIVFPTGCKTSLSSRARSSRCAPATAACTPSSLRADAVVGAAGDAYEGIARLLTDSVSQRPVSLLLSHRLCALPGCVQRLGDLADLQIVPLAPGAAALGALRHAAHLSNGPPNTLTLSLPWRVKPELRPPAGPPPQRVDET